MNEVIVYISTEKLKENSFAKEMFEDLQGEDYKALKNDIAKNGIRLPLEILEDYTIIDGHQRLRVAKELGITEVPCLIKKLTDWQAKIWVITANLTRRQLSAPQRALAIAKLSELYEVGRGTNPRNTQGQFTESAKFALSVGKGVKEITAEKTGYSPRTIEYYRAYKRAVEAFPELKNKPIIWAIKEAKRRQEKAEKRKLVQNVEIKNLILGDALTEVKKLQSESIDCIIIDPPYGINWHGTTISQNRDGWQPILNDDIKIFDYMQKLAPELYRVMKKDTDMYCFSGRFDSYCNMIKIFKEAGFRVSNVLIWKKNIRTSGPDFYHRYANLHEFIIYAKKGNRFLNNTFSPDVLEFNKVLNGYSALEKPIPLLSYLIQNSTNEGEVVLDCFAGTGSTLVAAEKLNRNWIGIEIDPKWYEIAKTRIYELRNEIF